MAPPLHLDAARSGLAPSGPGRTRLARRVLRPRGALRRPGYSPRRLRLVAGREEGPLRRALRLGRRRRARPGSRAKIDPGAAGLSHGPGRPREYPAPCRGTDDPRGRCRRVLATDLGWPGYLAILEEECERGAASSSAFRSARTSCSGSSPRGRLRTGWPLRPLKEDCDGLFLPAVSHHGVRIPLGLIGDRLGAPGSAAGLRHRRRPAPRASAAGPGVIYAGLVIAGCHKWPGRSRLSGSVPCPGSTGGGRGGRGRRRGPGARPASRLPRGRIRSHGAVRRDGGPRPAVHRPGGHCRPPAGPIPARPSQTDLRTSHSHPRLP